MSTDVIDFVENIKDKDSMIFDFLFSTIAVFHIDLQKYCTFKTRPIFRDEIRSIIKRGGVSIVDDRIIHTNETVIWKIEVRR